MEGVAALRHVRHRPALEITVDEAGDLGEQGKPQPCL
jgi:hypothetical protein